MNEHQSRRNFLKLGALSAASTVFLPRELFARYEESTEAQGNDVVLRCCVMSDVHFDGRVDAKEVPRFKRAIEFMYEYSAQQAYPNFDALLVVGDMTNHGTEPELTLFKKTMDELVKPGTEKLLCMGNHEFYGGNAEYWQSVCGVEPNRRYEVNGFHFIAISPEKGTMKDGDYLYMVDWLDRELEKIYREDQEKPIFVFQHYPVSPTVYGGRGWDDWGVEDLFDTLQKYPTVVNFSGHTHYPINDPRCAWQGCFTAFGTSTLSYLCHGHEGYRFQKYLPDDSKYGQFFVMETRRDNSVTLKPYDLATDSFFDVVYFVAKPGAIDEYVYTDKRYSESEKPTWREGTVPKITAEDAYFATIEFQQAYCKDVVLGYCVDLERKDPKTNEWVDVGACCFWSDYFLRDMPETAKGTLDNLEPDSEYRGVVTALNPFMRRSDETLSFAFKTPADPNDSAEKDSPTPKPDYYDISVVDGKLVNAPTNNWDNQFPLERRGEPRIDGAVVAFSGKDYYISPTPEEALKKLRRATIAAKFALDEDATGPNAVFGNTQMGGIELSCDANAKLLRLWVSVNGTYTVLDCPIELGKFYEAFGSFDGKTVALYLDGKEAARRDVRGVLTHTADSAARAFVFGGDIASGMKGEALMKGKIEYAKLYSWALTAEQVANLCKR